MTALAVHLGWGLTCLGGRFASFDDYGLAVILGPPSNHFKKLRSHLEGFQSVCVKKQWWLVFRWDGGRGEAAGVYLDDHRDL